MSACQCSSPVASIDSRICSRVSATIRMLVRHLVSDPVELGVRGGVDVPVLDQLGAHLTGATRDVEIELRGEVGQVPEVAAVLRGLRLPELVGCSLARALD